MMNEAEMPPARTLYQCYACRRLVWIGPGDGKFRLEGDQALTYNLRSGSFGSKPIELCPDCDLLLRTNGLVETGGES